MSFPREYTHRLDRLFEEYGLNSSQQHEFVRLIEDIETTAFFNGRVHYATSGASYPIDETDKAADKRSQDTLSPKCLTGGKYRE